MLRYINANLAKAQFTGNFQEEYSVPHIHALIDDVPTADVQEVKHGKWCEGRFGNGITVPVSKYYICNYCNHTSQKKSRYCSYCGAKMDGKENKK